MYGSHWLGEKLLQKDGFDNSKTKFAIQVLKVNETVRHLQCKLLQLICMGKGLCLIYQPQKTLQTTLQRNEDSTSVESNFTCKAKISHSELPECQPDLLSQTMGWLTTKKDYLLDKLQPPFLALKLTKKGDDIYISVYRTFVFFFMSVSVVCTR